MLDVKNDGFVRILSLNRPEAMNALNPEIVDGLIDELNRAADDDSVRVVVFTGEGKVFTSGMDLNAFANMHEDDNARMFNERVPLMFEAFIDFPKPLMLAVNGVGAGFGATICGLTDMVFMAAGAKLRCPFPAIANVPEAGATATFPERMGHQKAMWFLLSTEWMDAHECVDAGLALEVIPDKELLEAVVKKAKAVSTFPTVALVETKALMTDSKREHLKTVIRKELKIFLELLAHPAGQEGVAAVLEKRQPDFSSF